MRMRTLRVVTTNPGKVREFRAALKPLSIRVVQVGREYPEIQAADFREVADFGVEWLMARGLRDFILEDAGLKITALGTFPGVYSKFVFQTIGCDGILRLLRGARDRRAEFVSVIGGEIGGRTVMFRGTCRGEIASSARGAAGFGFDPIFIPAGSTRTFAEMSVEAKNARSHRGRAIRKLASRLADNG